MFFKIGIAFYAQKAYRGRPSRPHWALVVHRSSYYAPDVLVFQVRQNGPQFFLSHKPEGVSLAAAPTCMGVLHIADVPLASGISPATVAEFVQTFPSMKEGDDPSGNIVWSCATWVIRVLHYLQTGRTMPPSLFSMKPLYLGLPCATNQLYDYIFLRLKALKEVPRTQQTPLPILNLRA